MRASRAMRRVWASGSDIEMAGGTAGLRACRKPFSLNPNATLAYYIGHSRRLLLRTKTGNRREPPLAYVWIPSQLFFERSGDRSWDRQHSDLRSREGHRAG